MRDDLDSLRQGFSNLLAEKEDMSDFFSRLSPRRLSIVEEPRLPTDRELGTSFRLEVSDDLVALRRINEQVNKLDEPYTSSGVKLQRIRLGKSWFFRIESEALPNTVFLATPNRYRALLVELVRNNQTEKHGDHDKK